MVGVTSAHSQHHCCQVWAQETEAWLVTDRNNWTSQVVWSSISLALFLIWWFICLFHFYTQRGAANFITCEQVSFSAAFFLCQIPFFLTPHDLPCLLLPCTLICNILANIVSLLVLCTQNSTDPVDVLWFPQLDYNTIGYNCLLLPRRFNYWLRPLHVVVACRRRLWLDTIINVNLTEIERHEDIF